MLLADDGTLQKIPRDTSSRLLRALSLPDLQQHPTSASDRSDGSVDGSDEDDDTFYDSQSDVSSHGSTSLSPRALPAHECKDAAPKRDPEFFRKKYRKVVHMCRFLVNHTLNRRGVEILSAAGRVLDGRPVRFTGDMEALITQVMTAQDERTTIKGRLDALAEGVLSKRLLPQHSEEASAPGDSEHDIAADYAALDHHPPSDTLTPPPSRREKTLSVHFRVPLLSPAPSPCEGFDAVSESESPPRSPTPTPPEPTAASADTAGRPADLEEQDEQEAGARAGAGFATAGGRCGDQTAAGAGGAGGGERSPSRGPPQSKRSPAVAAPPAARDAPPENRPSPPPAAGRGEESENGINLSQTVARSGSGRFAAPHLGASVIPRPSDASVREGADGAADGGADEAPRDAIREKRAEGATTPGGDGRARDETDERGGGGRSDAPALSRSSNRNRDDASDGDKELNCENIFTEEINTIYGQPIGFGEESVDKDGVQLCDLNGQQHEERSVLESGTLSCSKPKESQNSTFRQRKKKPAPQPPSQSPPSPPRSVEFSSDRTLESENEYHSHEMYHYYAQSRHSDLTCDRPNRPHENVQTLQGVHNCLNVSHQPRQAVNDNVLSSGPLKEASCSEEYSLEISENKAHTEPKALRVVWPPQPPNSAARSSKETQREALRCPSSEPPQEPAPAPPHGLHQHQDHPDSSNGRRGVCLACENSPNFASVLSAPSLEEALVRFEKQIQEAHGGGSPGTASSSGVQSAQGRVGDGSPQGAPGGSHGDRGDSDCISMEDTQGSLRHSPECAAVADDSVEDWSLYLTIDYDPERVGPAEREIWAAMEPDQTADRPINEWVSNLMPSNRYHPRVLSPGNITMTSIKEECEDKSTTASPSSTPPDRTTGSASDAYGQPRSASPDLCVEEKFPTFSFTTPSPVNIPENHLVNFENKQDVCANKPDDIALGCLVDFDDESSTNSDSGASINTNIVTAAGGSNPINNLSLATELISDGGAPRRETAEGGYSDSFTQASLRELDRDAGNRTNQIRLVEREFSSRSEEENKLIACDTEREEELNELIELSRLDDSSLRHGDANYVSLINPSESLTQLRGLENSDSGKAEADVISINVKEHQSDRPATELKVAQDKDLIKMSLSESEVTTDSLKSNNTNTHSDNSIFNNREINDISEDVLGSVSLERNSYVKQITDKFKVIGSSNVIPDEKTVPQIFIQDIDELTTPFVTPRRNSLFDSGDEHSSSENVEDLFNSLIEGIQSDRNIIHSTHSIHIIDTTNNQEDISTVNNVIETHENESLVQQNKKEFSRIEGNRVLQHIITVPSSSSSDEMHAIEKYYDKNHDPSFGFEKEDIPKDIDNLMTPPLQHTVKALEDCQSVKQWSSESDVVPLAIRVTQWTQFWDHKVTSQESKEELEGVQRSIKNVSTRVEFFKCPGSPESQQLPRLHPSIRIPGIVNKWRQSFEKVVEANKVAKEFLKYRSVKKRKSILKYNEDKEECSVNEEDCRSERMSRQLEPEIQRDSTQETYEVNPKLDEQLLDWPQSNFVTNRKKSFEEKAQSVEQHRQNYFKTIPPRRKTTTVTEFRKFWDGLSKGHSCNDLIHMHEESGLVVTEEIRIDDPPTVKNDSGCLSARNDAGDSFLSGTANANGRSEYLKKQARQVSNGRSIDVATDSVGPRTERQQKRRSNAHDEMTPEMDVWKHTDRVPITSDKVPSPKPRRTTAPTVSLHSSTPATSSNETATTITAEITETNTGSATNEWSAERPQTEAVRESAAAPRRLHVVSAEDMWYPARRIPIEEVDADSSGSDRSQSLDDSTDQSWPIAEEGEESQSYSLRSNGQPSSNSKRSQAVASDVHAAPRIAALPRPRADREARSRFENAKLFFQTLEQGSGAAGAVAPAWGKRRGRVRGGTDLDTTSTDDTGSDGSVRVARVRRRGTCNARPRAVHSAPASDSETPRLSLAGGACSSGGGRRGRKQLSERFLVSGLFRDVSGGGVPHRREMLAALAAVDSRPTSPYADLEAAMAPVEESDALAAPFPHAYDSEYPYLPSTDPRQVRPRSTLQSFALAGKRIIGFEDV